MSLSRVTPCGHIVSPAAWSGEDSCAVGPFSSREVAHYFATHVLAIENDEMAGHTICVRGDEWFVEVSAGGSSRARGPAGYQPRASAQLPPH